MATLATTTQGLDVREVAKAAFYQQHDGLSAVLTQSFPNGCSLAEAIGWAEQLPWRISEHGDEWKLLYLTAVIAGRQETIDGRVVDCEQPIAAWSGCSLMPSFASHGEAREWADQAGLNLASQEVG